MKKTLRINKSMNNILNLKNDKYKNIDNEDNLATNEIFNQTMDGFFHSKRNKDNFLTIEEKEPDIQQDLKIEKNEDKSNKDFDSLYNDAIELFNKKREEARMPLFIDPNNELVKEGVKKQLSNEIKTGNLSIDNLSSILTSYNFFERKLDNAVVEYQKWIVPMGEILTDEIESSIIKAAKEKICKKMKVKNFYAINLSKMFLIKLDDGFFSDLSIDDTNENLKTIKNNYRPSSPLVSRMRDSSSFSSYLLRPRSPLVSRKKKKETNEEKNKRLFPKVYAHEALVFPEEQELKIEQTRVPLFSEEDKEYLESAPDETRTAFLLEKFKQYREQVKLPTTKEKQINEHSSINDYYNYANQEDKLDPELDFHATILEHELENIDFGKTIQKMKQKYRNLDENEIIDILTKNNVDLEEAKKIMKKIMNKKVEIRKTLKAIEPTNFWNNFRDLYKSKRKINKNNKKSKIKNVNKKKINNIA